MQFTQYIQALLTFNAKHFNVKRLNTKHSKVNKTICITVNTEKKF